VTPAKCNKPNWSRLTLSLGHYQPNRLPHHQRRRGVLLTALASFLFGVNGAVAADLLASMPAGNTAQIRSVLAALVLGAMAYRRRQMRHNRRLLQLAGLGVVLAAVSVSFFVAISRLGVGPGVTIQFTGPLLVLAWLRMVEHRRVPRSAWIAAAIALVGVALVSGAWETDRLDPMGLLAAGIASITFAAYLIGSGHLSGYLPTLTIAAYGFGFSALLLLIVFPVRLPPLEPLVIAELAWLVVLGTVAPFLLEVAALRMIDAGTVGVVATLEPAIAGAAAWIWLGQRLDLVQVFGGLMVVVAVAVVQRFTGAEPTPVG
jgi:drug/metabolite transporter (DMT)-like permease